MNDLIVLVATITMICTVKLLYYYMDHPSSDFWTNLQKSFRLPAS